MEQSCRTAAPASFWASLWAPRPPSFLMSEPQEPSPSHPQRRAASSGLEFWNVPCPSVLQGQCLSTVFPAAPWLLTPRVTRPSSIPVHSDPALSAPLSTGSPRTPRSSRGRRAARPPWNHAHAARKSPYLLGQVAGVGGAQGSKCSRSGAPSFVSEGNSLLATVSPQPGPTMSQR